MDHVIEIGSLVKEYETGFWRKKRVRALDDISLNVRPGQIFGFLGGNGAGKTTTIKILMGLLFPTSGTARILGRDISDQAMHNRIGYCPENPYFYDYLTPRELLGYFASLFGMNPGLSSSRTEELLRSVGLRESDWDKQLRKFSKGMLQRVGLAQSLINDPELVFLDEPMSGLDPIGRREVRELIAGLRSAGKTVFMSTHILSDVEALCDEVAVLRRGRIGATGTLDELLLASPAEQTFEVVLRGVDESTVRAIAPEGAQTSLRGGSVAVSLGDENEIEKLLAAAHERGGSVVSVQAMKQSLEDLFADPTPAPTATAHE